MTAQPLRLGIELPVDEIKQRDGTPRWADILAMAHRAEALGFASVWVEDHLLLRYGERGTFGAWDGWSLLAALAAGTSRIELGALVLPGTIVEKPGWFRISLTASDAMVERGLEAFRAALATPVG